MTNNKHSNAIYCIHFHNTNELKLVWNDQWIFEWNSSIRAYLDFSCCVRLSVSIIRRIAPLKLGSIESAVETKIFLDYNEISKSWHNYPNQIRERKWDIFRNLKNSFIFFYKLSKVLFYNFRKVKIFLVWITQRYALFPFLSKANLDFTKSHSFYSVENGCYLSFY